MSSQTYFTLPQTRSMTGSVVGSAMSTGCHSHYNIITTWKEKLGKKEKKSRLQISIDFPTEIKVKLSQSNPRCAQNYSSPLIKIAQFVLFLPPTCGSGVVKAYSFVFEKINTEMLTVICRTDCVFIHWGSRHVYMLLTTQF